MLFIQYIYRAVNFFKPFFQKYEKIVKWTFVVLLIEMLLLLASKTSFVFFKSQTYLSFVICYSWFSILFVLLFSLFINSQALKISTELNRFNKYSWSIMVVQGYCHFILMLSTLDLIISENHNFHNYMMAFSFAALLVYLIIFFLYFCVCKRILKVSLDSTSKKNLPLFYESVCRSVLIALTAWLTIFVNNKSNEFLSSLLTFLSTISALLYPMLDMYKFTRTRLDEYEKEKIIEAERKRQEEIENESNGSKNYTA